MTQPSSRPDRLTLMAFAGAVCIGGMNFVAIRFSNRELSPLFGAALRFSTAALLLLAFMAVQRIPFPRGKALLGTVLYGLLMIAVTYGLMYWAFTSLPAGVGAVLFAAAPLLTLVLARLHGLNEKFHLRGLAGGLMALVGIAVLTKAPTDAALPLLPLLAMTGAAISAAEAGVIIKKFPPTHPVATNATAMAISAPVLFLLSASLGETWKVPEQTATFAAVGYLAFVGSVAFFGLYLFALSRWTVTAMSYMPVLMPVVAMIAGSILAKEPITMNGAIGALLVLGGVYVGVLAKGGAPKS